MPVRDDAQDARESRPAVQLDRQLHGGSAEPGQRRDHHRTTDGEAGDEEEPEAGAREPPVDLGAARPARAGAHARQQRDVINWLGEKIVGASLKPTHPA